jgi:lambda repressor-like predicted transcriptional regulator
MSAFRPYPDTEWITAQLVQAWARHKAAGMTLEILARRSGLSQPYLSRILDGQRPNYKWQTLLKLATALEMDFAVLLQARTQARVAPEPPPNPPPPPSPTGPQCWSRAQPAMLAASVLLSYGDLLRLGV